MRTRITPEKVTELSMCEIFVFGSNMAGHHRGGAARIAYERFGAEWGIGVGRTGKSYAIPTMHRGVEDIRPYVEDFIEYVKSHPNNRFLITRIGCGKAGFKDEQIAPLFKELNDAPNVCLPLDWKLILDNDKNIDAFFTGIIPEKSKVPIPEAITENDLIRLSQEYKYVIGARIVATPKPDIQIRYVIDRDRFGYARFGDFFFTENGNLYVWTRNKEFASKHDQEVVELFFGDECKNRGYCHPAIFAGVKTPFIDSNGDAIYTGDVLRLGNNKHDPILALGTLGENSDDRNAFYAFPLDNHCLIPEQEECMTRIGTVFYQLEWNNNKQTIRNLCYRFQPWYPDGLTDKDRKTLCRYTPNFDQELWKYYACETLNIKFNWRNNKSL